MDGGGGAFLAWRRRHSVPAGTPCCNCATAMQGPWCHDCGQSAHDFHRSAWHLASETFESFFHADGRLWRTLGGLLRNPARLTRDYLAGKRAPQIPPLRLFLVMLLLLFVVARWASPDLSALHLGDTPPEVQKQVLQSQVHLGLSPAWDKWATGWLRAHLGRAMAHPDALASAISARAQDFAFMMLPISALILAAIFVFRRGFVLFDHLVFSMHSLSFQGLLIIAVIAGHGAVGGEANDLFWAAPIHLFAHMRGVYGTGRLGTLGRMAVLFVASILAFALLLVGLIVAGVSDLRG